MNADAIPAGQLACLLAGTASGISADTAAVALITAHGHFLHQRAFRRFIAAETSMFTGEPVTMIRWKAVITALDDQQLPCSTSEQAIVRIAASLGDDTIPVHLRQVLGSLDRRNITLVTAALTRANG